jgi:hypothetical protein
LFRPGPVSKQCPSLGSSTPHFNKQVHRPGAQDEPDNKRNRDGHFCHSITASSRPFNIFYVHPAYEALLAASYCVDPLPPASDALHMNPGCANALFISIMLWIVIIETIETIEHLEHLY